MLMFVRGDHEGTFGGYELAGGIKKHPTGEISWSVVAQPSAGGMKSYWVRRGEFLNPLEQTAYLLAAGTHNLKIGKAHNVSGAEKKAILDAIAEWEL